MRDATRSFYREAIQRVIGVIYDNLDAALDLEALAATARLSPFHFHRVFRGMVGETPLELARRLRMERAARRLTATADPVTAIAFDAGYDTHEAFTRAFRAFYAVPPTSFRKLRYPRGELPAACGVHYREGEGPSAFVPRDSGGRTMNVEIVERPAKRVATIRHVGPYNQIAHAFERLGALAGPAGFFENREAEMIALYHDDPDTTPPAELRADAGISVPEDAALPAECGEERLPGGTYARYVHIGPYEQLGDVWARLMGEWIPASGRRIGEGICYERYRNSPMTAPPDKLETELYVPLA